MNGFERRCAHSLSRAFFWALGLSLTCGSWTIARADEQVYQQTGADLALAKYGLTGKGVVVAILDRGIQWAHPDFRKPDGTTRIKYMLDMTGQIRCSPNNPAPVEYTEAQLNTALSGGGGIISMRDAVGHGTATAGMAAGNGRAIASGKFKGIAPEADLIVVKLVSEGAVAHGAEPAEAAFGACYTQAISWLDQKITELGKPAVALINSGVQLFGPTDGTSVISRTVDQYFSNRPGRVFVFASGDEGLISSHAAGTFNGANDTVVSFTHNTADLTMVAMWYSGPAKAQITLKLSDGTILGPLAPPNAPVNSRAATADNSVVLNQYFPGSENYPATSNSGDRFVLINIQNHIGTGTLTIRGLTAADNGKFDIYTDVDGNTTLSSSLVLGRIQELGATRSALVAAASVVRTNWVDIMGNAQSNATEGAANALWTGSSGGPTRDGRIGVTVAAPGHNTFTTYAVNSVWATNRFNVIQEGGGFYGMAGATSGASPILTGAAALLLQLKPNLSSQQVRNYIQASAKADGFTGPVPNNLWGYGKLNILGALDLAAQCTFALSAGGQAFSSAGGSGTITMTAPAGCPWSVDGLPAGITVNTQSGTGNATINYQVAASAAASSKTFSIGTQTFTVEQQAATIPGLSFAGSMPHLASAGTWQTFFTLVNTGAAAATARLNLYSDPGAPLALPFTLNSSGSLMASSLDRTIGPDGVLTLDSNGPDSRPVDVGSAHLFTNGAVKGFAVFRWKFLQQEAVVPLEIRNAASYLLPFDNTNGVDLGVAIGNVANAAANIDVLIKDDIGAQIGTGNLSLPALGHASWVLKDQFPVTANRRGTMEFKTPAGGRIAALGVRFTPPGTLTTIPVMANVGTTGGAMAHLASGGGWKTSIVLVNTGTSAANTSLRFYDDPGNPLPLPLTFPQGIPAATTATVDRTLNAGATLVIDSEAPANTPVKIGSLQLTTNGNVSGFVVFRYQPNGQEAVVPLEDRSAPSYILAFDNTAGVATGVAVSNAGASALAGTVAIKDEAGTSLGAAPLNIPANGHISFVLADQYPATVNRRGTIEFIAAPGGKLSALGIRTTVPQLTFTSLPAIIR